MSHPVLVADRSRAPAEPLPRRRRVLAIAYHFPPVANSASIRNLKILRHFPACGWDVDLLTTREQAAYPGEATDPKLLEQLPQEIHAIRTGCFYLEATLSNWKRKLSGLLWRSPNKNQPTSSAMAEAETDDPAESRSRVSWWQRLKDSVSYLVSTPDKVSGWIPFAVWSGRRALKRRKYDVIYAIGKPWTAFFVGDILKRLSGLPLVIDFMDPWRASTWAPSRGRWFDRLQDRLERYIVRRADAVIANTRELADDFHHRLNVPREKLTVVTCGFDEEDFRRESSSPAARSDKFTFLHAGTLYRRRNPYNFLLGLKQAVDRGAIPADQVCVSFVGRMSIDDHRLQELLRDPVLEAILHREDWVPHAEIIRRLETADVLLLIQPDTKLQIPAKLYEYILLDKPILALAEPDSAVESIIRREHWGQCIANADIEHITTTLIQMYDDFKSGRSLLRPAPGSLIAYSNRALAERLTLTFASLPSLRPASHVRSK